MSSGLLGPGTAGQPRRPVRLEPGWAPLASVCGAAGPCRDEVAATLIVHGLATVYLNRPVLDGREHWLLWHRGPVLVVLVDPSADDWRLTEAIRGPVILVWSIQPELADIVDALRRGVRALVQPVNVATELPAVLGLAARGYTVFPAILFDQLAGLLAGRPDRWPGGLPELTARERDILDSIARGHTVRQTARALGIAVKTVENTQARLFRKLGAQNRAEALTVANRLGLVEPRDA